MFRPLLLAFFAFFVGPEGPVAFLLHIARLDASAVLS